MFKEHLEQTMRNAPAEYILWMTCSTAIDLFCLCVASNYKDHPGISTATAFYAGASLSDKLSSIMTKTEALGYAISKTCSHAIDKTGLTGYLGNTFYSLANRLTLFKAKTQSAPKENIQAEEVNDNVRYSKMG